MSPMNRCGISKRHSGTRTTRTTPLAYWKVLRTGKGWVHLTEADAHLDELAQIVLDNEKGTKLTIHEASNSKLVFNYDNVCTLTEFAKSEFYDDDEFHLIRISLVKRVDGRK